MEMLNMVVNLDEFNYKKTIIAVRVTEKKKQELQKWAKRYGIKSISDILRKGATMYQREYEKTHKPITETKPTNSKSPNKAKNAKKTTSTKASQHNNTTKTKQKKTDSK